MTNTQTIDIPGAWTYGPERDGPGLRASSSLRSTNGTRSAD